MLSVWVTFLPAIALSPTAIALGNFDGIHRGHQRVISSAFPSKEGQGQQRAHVTLVTFYPHPKAFFTGQSRQLLTPLSEKVKQLKHLGVEQLVLLPFNQELASLMPEAFVTDILVKQLQATQISVGADFCFGRQRSGTAADLQAIASKLGVEVVITQLQREDGDRISSSAIRLALETGDLATANHLLGRAYTLIGEVVSGQCLGRTIGFPTANLQLPPEKFLPRTGVYAVQVEIIDRSEVEPSLPYPLASGVMNLGYRPTVNGTGQVPEVHLFDWVDDLYGKTLVVHLQHFLRPEQKFASLEALKQQIQIDCEAARSLLTSNISTTS